MLSLLIVTESVAGAAWFGCSFFGRASVVVPVSFLRDRQYRRFYMLRLFDWRSVSRPRRFFHQVDLFSEAA